MRTRIASLGALLAVMAAALAIACTPTTTAPATPATTATAAAKAGTTPTAAGAVTAPAGVAQRLTMALPLMPQTDLNTYNAGYPNGYFLSPFMEGLTTFQNDKTEVKPQLATSWKTVDPSTWEFTLKPNVKFHNGETLQASDVVFSVKGGLDQNIAALSFATFTRNFNTLDQITAPNATTVRVTTKGPDPIMPNRFGALGVYVYPEKAFVAQGRDAFFAKPIGTGPFKVDSFTPNQKGTLSKFADWHGGRVGLDQLNAVSIPENSARLASMRSGETDMVERVDVDQIPEVTSSPGAKTNFAIFNVGVNLVVNTTVPTLQDKRVRLAMNHAIDAKTYTEQRLRGVTKPLPGQPVPLTTFGADQNIKTYEFSVARGRQLMAEAGFPNGFTVDLGSPTFREQFAVDAQAVQPMLAAIGVQTVLKPVDIVQFQQGNVPGGADRLPPLFVSAVSTAELADPATAYASFLPVDQGGVGRWTNPQFTALYNQSRSELDVAKRRVLYEQMNKIFNEDPPIVNLYQFYNGWGLSERVGPFQPTAGGQPECWCTLIRVK